MIMSYKMGFFLKEMNCVFSRAVFARTLFKNYILKAT